MEICAECNCNRMATKRRFTDFHFMKMSCRIYIYIFFLFYFSSFTNYVPYGREFIARISREQAVGRNDVEKRP